MTFNAFKSKISDIDFKTGAKKVLATVVLTTVMLSQTISVAHAAVPAENIIGDLQVSEDRTSIKRQDAQDIFSYFYGFDAYGNQTISIEEIEKAIELSDVLNDYFFDSVIYTNTTKNEVLSLDIDAMYEDYTEATQDYRYNDVEFCEANLENKPAIDAYITFACGTISNNLKSIIANKVNSVIATEGFKMTSNPKVLTMNNKLYVVLEIEGQAQVFEVTGTISNEIVSLCNTLDNHSQIALNNIGGYSNEYENTFAYNGIDKYTNESVWLSFPDTEKQQEITKGIEYYKNILNDEEYNLTSNDPGAKRQLTEEEQTILRNLGYDEYQISNAVSREIVLEKAEVKKLTK